MPFSSPVTMQQRLKINATAGLVRAWTTEYGIDGIIRSVDQDVVETLGFLPEELLGKNGYDLVHPDDRAIGFEKAHIPVMAGLTPEPLSARYLTKRGTYIRATQYFEVHCGRDGDVESVFVHCVLEKQSEKDAVS